MFVINSTRGFFVPELTFSKKLKIIYIHLDYLKWYYFNLNILINSLYFLKHIFFCNQISSAAKQLEEESSTLCIQTLMRKEEFKEEVEI